MKIHLKKSHVETEDLEDNQVQSQTPIESTVLKCDFCSKTSSSLKGLMIHKTKVSLTRSHLPRNKYNILIYCLIFHGIFPDINMLVLVTIVGAFLKIMMS